MIRIDDFSKLSRVSVKALRYYDEEVYLNPAKNSSQNDPNTVTEIQFPVKKS